MPAPDQFRSTPASPPAGYGFPALVPPPLSAQLSCAVCVHMHWYAVECEQPPTEISPAVTILKGTALCALHIEDVDNGWLLGVVQRIGRAGGWAPTGGQR